jgi:hypothetical protein
MSCRANKPSSDITDTVTIYHSPRDMPGYYCVRRRMIGVFPNAAFLDPAAWGFRRLHDARAWVAQEFPYSSTRILPSPCDDPCVVETWL